MLLYTCSTPHILHVYTYITVHETIIHLYWSTLYNIMSYFHPYHIRDYYNYGAYTTRCTLYYYELPVYGKRLDFEHVLRLGTPLCHCAGGVGGWANGPWVHAKQRFISTCFWHVSNSVVNTPLRLDFCWLSLYCTMVTNACVIYLLLDFPHNSPYWCMHCPCMHTRVGGVGKSLAHS